MKKYTWLIILILVIISLIVVSVVFSESDDKYLKELNVKDVVEKINDKDSFMLYIKQTDCSHCKEFTPNFISVLSKNKLKAYTLNLSDLTEEDKTLYEEHINVTGTPTVLFYTEGNENLIRIEGAQNKNKITSKLEATGFIK